MLNILSIQNLKKYYGSVKAVDDISLTVGQGQVFGILGPNGSGKTTTLGVILDVINANEGTYHWFDEKPTHEHRKRIGSILETPNFYPYLSAVNNLKIIADIKETDHSDIDRVLDIVDLTKRKNHQFKTYSLGMKQRLAIGAALLGNPEVLVLDEPTNGLDPQGIAEVRNLIIQLGKQGITIIIASHLLDEVEKVCSHVAVLKKGKILFSGNVTEVLNDNPVIELVCQDMEQLRAVLSGNGRVSNLRIEGPYLLAQLMENMGPEELNKYLFDQGIVLSHLSLRKKSLESHFLELTK